MQSTSAIGDATPAPDDFPDAEAILDRSPITSGQWLVIVLCALLSMLDGFDTQSIAFAAPEIRREWGMTAAALGPIFSAGLLGGVLGGFFIGPLSDRVGPKRIVILSTLVFAFGTLATVLTKDILALAALRAVTGVGLGAAIPAIVAILAAYSPARVRALFVTSAFSIQLLGAVVGSMASARLMEHYGWQAVFILGGALPLILLPIIAARVPEPLTILAARGRTDQIERALRLIGRAGQVMRIGARPDAPDVRNSAAALFRDGRATATILLMSTSMIGGVFFYFLANWLPSILRDSGHNLQDAIHGSTALNAGGLIGTLVFARLIDRYGPYGMMTLGYLGGGALTMAVAFGGGPINQILALIFVAGLFGIGAQFSVPAAVVRLYPPELRGAGIGFALGFTRIGAMVGPLFGSYILLQGGGPRELYVFAGVCAFGAAVCIFGARLWEGRRRLA